jgi:succinyl-diaminopimelate desuccinylase
MRNANLLDPVALTQTLLTVNTVNPPGNESAACDVIEPLLHDIGLITERVALADGRDNLIAYPPRISGPLLCFTGHLDTVPIGFEPWSYPAFEGRVHEGKLYGRGSSDMKGGIASFLCSLAAVISHSRKNPPVMLVLTAGEETGAEGAKSLIGLKSRQLPVAAILVGEPTCNRLVIGHKGALWLKASTNGVAAHGSMPERGENAIYKATDAIQRIRNFKVEPGFSALLGNSTLSVGTFKGGMNVNSVPDRAEFEIDIRTVEAGSNQAIANRLQTYLGDLVRLRAQVDVPSMQTDPNDPWMKKVASVVADTTGIAQEKLAVSFFTDGPALRDIWGDVPTAILGPGEPSCAHTVDEYCEVLKLQEGVRIYTKIIDLHCDN